MTTNRRHKAAARARQHAAAEPYTLARRRVRTLDQVLHEHPRLCDYGFGTHNEHRKTGAAAAHDLQLSRHRLRQDARHIEAVRDWLLANVAPIKTPHRNSYGLKHTVEQAIGDYVSNGQLIAAALIAGYPISRPDGPNVLVAVSARDLTRLRRQTR